MQMIRNVNRNMRTTSYQNNQINSFNNNNKKNNYIHYTNNNKNLNNTTNINSRRYYNYQNQSNKNRIPSIIFSIENIKNRTEVPIKLKTSSGDNNQRNNLSITNKPYINNEKQNNSNKNNIVLYNKRNNYSSIHHINNTNYATNKRQNHNYFERLSSNKNKEPRNERFNTFQENNKIFKNKVKTPNYNKSLLSEKLKKNISYESQNKFSKNNNSNIQGYRLYAKYSIKRDEKNKLNKIQQEKKNYREYKVEQNNNKRYNTINYKQNKISFNNNSKLKKSVNNENSLKPLKKEEKLFNVIKCEIGINNIGNTCFINSCLQVLIHCPLFMYRLIKKIKLINENTPVTSNFISICEMMADSKENSINISDFKNLVGIKHKIFEGYLQNDSQEFCRILLEDISRELNEVKEQTLYRLLSNSDQKSKKLRDNDFFRNFSKREKSIVTDLFYAQIVNIFTCECKSEIYSFQKILDFPLLFPQKIDNNIVTLNELLKLYFQTEFIDFDSNCEKCQNKAKHKKEIKISRPPEILILSLQRIGEYKKKLGYSVNFEENIDISEFIDKDCGYARDCNYQLFAVINHSGSINSGHYYTYLKIEKKDWFEFNDSKVKKIEDISDSSETAYALFYIKQKYINSKFYKFN